MKFSYKILLCSIIIMAVAFGTGGYLFVNNVFDTSLKREVGQAMDESSILQFAFETAALNVPSKYGFLQDTTVNEIGANLEKSSQSDRRLIRISDENKNIIYSSDDFTVDTELLYAMEERVKMYKVIEYDGKYYVLTGSEISALDRIFFLETMRDVTEVFEERKHGFSVYRNITVAMLLAASVLMFFIATWLTRPIRLLTGTARKMAAGDYECRARRISNDEMGQLTEDFNNMAESLEKNIKDLENEVRAREDFIAAFSHELKTPLTSIIGYADLLRSRKLDDEKHFLSANYIYTEGKRLENMSLRLLDIIVTKRQTLERQEVNSDVFFEYIKALTAEKADIQLDMIYDTAQINVETNLIKTVLLNLVDNAYKASLNNEADDKNDAHRQKKIADVPIRIEVIGKSTPDGYMFSVKDYGAGIEEKECRRITEAFYMVDKSRSRSLNGAGLGLALCTEILKLHGSSLVIESKPKEGSTFSFMV
jgi:signal transduction histidine kinase